jgi:hypothetical protein
VFGTGRSVQLHGNDRITPSWSRTSTQATSSRQKTRQTRPRWPQDGLSSETIVRAAPLSATYGAVCRWVKGHDQ